MMHTLMNIIAHGGETHSSVAVEKAHELAWFVQVPLFALVVGIFSGTLWIVTKKANVTLLITSAGLLISGFGFFQIAPVVSMLAITLGLITTLSVTLLGLGAGSEK